MIRFECPCGRKLQAAESNAGQPARCPLCERVTIVPFADGEPSPPTPPELRDDAPDEALTDRPVYPMRDDDRPRYDRDRVADSPRYDDDRPRRPTYDEDYEGAYGRGYRGPQRTCSDANTALWMSLVGIFCCAFLCPVAVIYGIKAINQINNSNGELTGKGQAIAGLVVGLIGSALSALNQIGRAHV